MRGGLAWLCVLATGAGCGFHPAAGSADAPGGSGSDLPGTDAATATGDGGSPPASDAQPALACPSGGGWFQVAGSASWYFAITSTNGWQASETACEALQLAGGGSAIHLAVLDQPGELAALAAHDTSHDYWIGMFQQANQAAPEVGWLWITGAPGLASAWSSGEPNDDGFLTTGDENDDEDFGQLYTDRASLNDEGGGNDERALCECDGVPVPAATRMKIPQ